LHYGCFTSAKMCRVHTPKVPNLWGAPHGRAQVDCMRATLILNEIWAQDKIHILLRGFLCLNMKVALLYSLNFNEVYINLCQSVYLNLLRWNGGAKFMKRVKGAQAIKFWKPLA